MMQPKAKDETLPMMKLDRLPPTVNRSQHQALSEIQSWARCAPIQILGVILMLIVVWLSVSGRVCGTFRRIRQHSHDSMEPGSLEGSAHLQIDKNRPPYREYRRHETSASITGHFELYDLLELTSQTGNIDITFTPQPRKTRAVLHLGSRTGSIRVRLAPEFLSAASESLTKLHGHQSQTNNPQTPYVADFTSAEIKKTISRPFTNEIHTETGAITAKILAGNGDTTHVGCDTGSLNLEIMAVGVGEKNPRSLLDTVTGTGSQTIRVMPLNISKDPVITNLAAQHVSKRSGSMDFFYSDEWRGNVSVVSAGSGSIDVGGTDLEIDLQEPRKVKAHRGMGELINIVSQGSGSVTFTN